MIVGESQAVRTEAGRWIEEGQSQYLGLIQRILQDYDRLQEAVEAAERENEQLRTLVYENERLKNRVELAERESEQLREEAGRLRTANERFRHEREEVAEALTRMMNEALVLLRTQPA
jgi:uncharacterized protein (DUF342 family)